MSETESLTSLITAGISDQRKPFLIDAPEGRTLIALPRAQGTWDQIDVTSPNKADVLRPKIVTQVVHLQTVESMIEYLNRFKNFDSVVFADIQANSILGIIDYHKMPEANRGDETTPAPAGAPVGHDADPQLGKHQARMTLPFSLEYQTWTGSNCRLKSHREFATFLEENSIDVMPLGRPAGMLATSETEADAPTTLLELTRSLQVVQNVNFNSSVRHGSYDKVDFQKEADATARGSIQLPLSFRINIPIYFGERPIEIEAFIRKEIDDGHLKIGYSLNRVENKRQEEFQKIVGTIAGIVGLSTVYGKPVS